MKRCIGVVMGMGHVWVGVRGVGVHVVGMHGLLSLHFLHLPSLQLLWTHGPCTVMHIGVRVIRHPVAIVTSITRVYMAWWRQSVAVFRVHWGSRRELPRGIWWRGVDCMRGEHVGVGRVGGVHSCSLRLAQVAILHCKVHRRVCGVGRRGTVQCSGLGLVRGSQ